MRDRLRWPRAFMGALFGGLCALVLLALDVVHDVFGCSFDAEYGEPIYYTLLLLGPVLGFVLTLWCTRPGPDQ